MNYSTRKGVLKSTGAILAASAATFAAAVAITVSGPALAAPQDYRFELVQAAPAGPGKSDVTVRLVRTADGTPVANAEISAATAINTVAEQAGSRRFRVETATAGPSTLLVSAKVPGATRVERTFNSSIKATLERKVRGKSELVSGAVTFDAQ